MQQQLRGQPCEMNCLAVNNLSDMYLMSDVCYTLCRQHHGMYKLLSRSTHAQGH